jgi:hypothetical protein
VSGPSRPPGGGGTFAPRTPVEPDQGRPQRPKELDISVWLWLATIAIGLAAAVVETLLLKYSTIAPELKELAAANKTIDLNQLHRSFPVFKGVAVGISVVTHGVWVLFVLKCRSGRHWARSIMAVLGVLWVVYTLVTVPQLPVGQLLAALAQTLAMVSAIYYMFRPESNKYFAALRPPPPGRPPR